MAVVVAITGASGVVYAKRLLEVLKDLRIEVALTISNGGEKVISSEMGDFSKKKFEKLATEVFDAYDVGAPIASGSLAHTRYRAMVIIPCTMATLGAIASGNTFGLISRAADVMMKERRPLVIVPRETPLNEIHLENMLKLRRMGVNIIPAMPAFYNSPKTIDDMVNFVVGRVLDVLEIENKVFPRYLECQQEE